MGLCQPIGLLQETFQGLRSASSGKPSSSLPVKQQTVKHPPNQLCLGDLELPRPRLQCPLVLLALVQLLPDHTYVIYIISCHSDFNTMFGSSGGYSEIRGAHLTQLASPKAFFPGYSVHAHLTHLCLLAKVDA